MNLHNNSTSLTKYLTVMKRIKKFIINIFGLNFFEFLLRIYLVFTKPSNYKMLFYRTSKDLKNNEYLITRFGHDKKYIKEVLRRNNLNYFEKKLSWHYHIFAALKKDNLKILEIGTYNGEFARFLSNVYYNSIIYTIDLPENDERFINSYERNELNEREKFLNIRNKNLKNKNIKFIEMDSINLTKKFGEEYFDLIWIDGDHHDPQVSLDIKSSIRLIKKDGIFCCDDVIISPVKEKDGYISTESHVTLDNLEKEKKIKNYYFVKLIRLHNALGRPYTAHISLSKKLNI